VSDPAVLLATARRELGRLVPVLEPLLADLDDGKLRSRPVPTEWAPVEILCHLRDEETEDFGARLRVVVEGGTQFTPIDPERWAIERGYLEAVPREALEALRTRRGASLAWLRALDPERLHLTVSHPGAGSLSGLDLLAAWVCHDRLHLHQLTGTLARLWATRWAPLRTGYAGPIPYGPEASA